MFAFEILGMFILIPVVMFMVLYGEMVFLNAIVDMFIEWRRKRRQLS